jgi:hypothetical protein
VSLSVVPTLDAYAVEAVRNPFAHDVHPKYASCASSLLAAPRILSLLADIVGCVERLEPLLALLSQGKEETTNAGATLCSTASKQAREAMGHVLLCVCHTSRTLSPIHPVLFYSQLAHMEPAEAKAWLRAVFTAQALAATSLQSRRVLESTSALKEEARLVVLASLTEAGREVAKKKPAEKQAPPFWAPREPAGGDAKWMLYCEALGLQKDLQVPHLRGLVKKLDRAASVKAKEERRPGALPLVSATAPLDALGFASLVHDGGRPRYYTTLEEAAMLV